MRSGWNFMDSIAGGRMRGCKCNVYAAEQRRLQQLQIALIAGRKFCTQAEHFVKARLRRDGASANEFKDIRVAFLRHD